MRNCKNVRDLDPITKLCPPCSTWHKDFNKRLASHERQQTAREEIQNQNRNIDSSPPPTQAWSPSTQAPQQAPAAFPAALPTASSVLSVEPPPIDVRSLQNSYNQLKNSSGSPVSLDTLPGLTLDMFALMLNIHSKMSETDAVRCEVKKATTRIEALEAKVGGMDEVSEKLGLAIRFLPLPPAGFSDLDIARQILTEIRAPGINVHRDVVKAIRKIPSKPPNTNQPILGTVLLEMKNEESRALIMKNKHTLQYHPDNTIRSVVIKNMKSREQMLIENIGNNILKRIPGCENAYLGGNGQIRESFGQKNDQPRHRSFENQPPHFRPQNLPPNFRPQVQPPQSGLQFNHVSPGYRHYNPNVQPPNHIARPQYNNVNQGRHDVSQQNSLTLPPQNYAYTPARMQGPPMLNSSVPAPPSYAAAPQAQARPVAPLQDLPTSLDSLYEQQSGPASAPGPDLHLMQPADPHHSQADQAYLHQHHHAGQDYHQSGDQSDSD